MLQILTLLLSFALISLTLLVWTGLGLELLVPEVNSIFSVFEGVVFLAGSLALYPIMKRPSASTTGTPLRQSQRFYCLWRLQACWW
jgi:hypothetical protein